MLEQVAQPCLAENAGGGGCSQAGLDICIAFTHSLAGSSLKDKGADLGMCVCVYVHVRACMCTLNMTLKPKLGLSDEYTLSNGSKIISVPVCVSLGLLCQVRVDARLVAQGKVV